MNDQIGNFYSKIDPSRMIHLMITNHVSLVFDMKIKDISWDEWEKGELQYNKLYQVNV